MYAVVIALTILGFFVQFAILSVYLYFRDSMYKSALRDWVKENELQIRDQFFGDNFATQVLNQKLKQWDVKINVIFVLLAILFALLYGNPHVQPINPSCTCSNNEPQLTLKELIHRAHTLKVNALNATIDSHNNHLQTLLPGWGKSVDSACSEEYQEIPLAKNICSASSLLNSTEKEQQELEVYLDENGLLPGELFRMHYQYQQKETQERQAEDAVINREIKDLKSKLRQDLLDDISSIYSILNPLSVEHNALVAQSAMIWIGSKEKSLPVGWSVCDGSNGTMDLRDKFLLGGGNIYQLGDIGGRESVTLDIANMPKHDHTDGEYKYLLKKNCMDRVREIQHGPCHHPNSLYAEPLRTQGDGKSFDIRPPYISVYFICRTN